MIDAIYLQKSPEYCGGELIGCEEDGNLFKGLIGFMIVGLQKSFPYDIKSIPETKFKDEWLPGLLKVSTHILSLIRPKIKSIFGVYDPLGPRYFFQLRVNLSLLRKY